MTRVDRPFLRDLLPIVALDIAAFLLIRRLIRRLRAS